MSSIHGVFHLVRIRPLALTAELLFTVHAVTTSNLETGNDPVPDIQVCDFRALLLDSAAELVAEDVAAFHLDDGTVEEMEVGAADGAAGDFEDNIAVFDDDGAGYFLDFDVAFTHPAQSFHGLGGMAILCTIPGRVADILIVWLEKCRRRHGGCLLLSTWAVSALSLCPMNFSTRAAACVRDIFD